LSQRLRIGSSLFLLILTVFLIQIRCLSPVQARPPAPSASSKILSVWVLGDSLTLGLYASSEETTYRQRLFQALQTEHPGAVRYMLWQSVCTLGGLEKRWDELPGKPDILFIEIGIHALQDGGQPNATGIDDYCIPVPKEVWQERYGAMLDRIQNDAPGVKIVVGTIPWCNWQPDSAFFQEALTYNAWIIAEARKRDIAVADLWSATVNKVDGISTPEQTSIFPPYHGDQFHPNDLGHRRLAETFLQAYWRNAYQIFTPLQTFSR